MLKKAKVRLLQKLPDIQYVNMNHTTNLNVFIFEPHTGFSSVSAWWRSMITNFPLVFHSLWARYTFSSSLRIRRSTLSELCRRPSWESAPDTSNSSTRTKFLRSSKSDRWAFIIAYGKLTINMITQSLIPLHKVINTKYLMNFSFVLLKKQWSHAVFSFSKYNMYMYIWKWTIILYTF